MKALITISTFIFISLSIASPAHALLGEARLHFGNAQGEPDEYNKAYYDFQDGPEISGQDYLGLDAIIMLPGIPFGFGLRYEATGEELTQFTETIDYASTRMALVLNYRMIDTGVFVGPIFTYGLSHDLEFKIPTDPEEFKAGGDSSYSIGVEAGLKFGLFRLGAEVGYLSYVFDDLKDIGGTVPNQNGLNISELDFSGMYYKAHLGLGF